MKVIVTRRCENVYLGVVALREWEVFNVCQGCVSSAIVLFIVKSWLICVTRRRGVILDVVSLWYDYVLNIKAPNVASKGRLKLFRGIPDINCLTE